MGKITIEAPPKYSVGDRIFVGIQAYEVLEGSDQGSILKARLIPSPRSIPEEEQREEFFKVGWVLRPTFTRLKVAG